MPSLAMYVFSVNASIKIGDEQQIIMRGKPDKAIGRIRLQFNTDRWQHLLLVQSVRIDDHEVLASTIDSHDMWEMVPTEDDEGNPTEPVKVPGLRLNISLTKEAVIRARYTGIVPDGLIRGEPMMVIGGFTGYAYE
jgi:hypothetical protein